VLQRVLDPIAADDLTRQTPCTEFDVAALTGHLLRSVAAVGGMVGADIPDRDESDSVERQVVAAARPALDAWHRRGLDGSVPFGNGEMPAKSACAILSIEFLGMRGITRPRSDTRSTPRSHSANTCWVWRVR